MLAEMQDGGLEFSRQCLSVRLYDRDQTMTRLMRWHIKSQQLFTLEEVMTMYWYLVWGRGWVARDGDYGHSTFVVDFHLDPFINKCLWILWLAFATYYSVQDCAFVVPYYFCY